MFTIVAVVTVKSYEYIAQFQTTMLHNSFLFSNIYLEKETQIFQFREISLDDNLTTLQLFFLRSELTAWLVGSTSAM